MKQKLHSDDFGLNPNVDAKLLALIENGSLSGVSILAPTVTKKSLTSLGALKKRFPHLTISLHFNMVEGKGIMAADDIPSIVDHFGHFYPSWMLFIRLLIRRIQAHEVRRELIAQLEFLEKNGVSVSMIDSHQHTHALSPIAEVVSEVGNSKGISYIRSFNTVRNNTLKARITYFILMLVSYASHIVYFGSLKLPYSWHIDSPMAWTIMSWEGRTYNSLANKSRRVFHVVHPYLSFDSNTTYHPQIKAVR